MKCEHFPLLTLVVQDLKMYSLEHALRVAYIALLVAAPCTAAGSKYKEGSRYVCTCRVSLTLVAFICQKLYFGFLMYDLVFSAPQMYKFVPNHGQATD